MKAHVLKPKNPNSEKKANSGFKIKVSSVAILSILALGTVQALPVDSLISSTIVSANTTQALV